ncbi:MAG: iron-sulfur cluster assembly scaffold protein [Candidatus Omnitrophica bacterium]|nr:iron-sulfur cluster assembly scaffold protein [Candidatus Omnitrophota bacterium]
MTRQGAVFFGKMKKPTAQACIQGPCGDTMEFFLKITRHTVRQVRCSTSGCGASKACAVETARMAQGKSLASVLLISPGKVIRALKNIPEGHLHCAILSVSTLHRAVADYLMRGKRKINIRGKAGSHGH